MQNVLMLPSVAAVRVTLQNKAFCAELRNILLVIERLSNSLFVMLSTKIASQSSFGTLIMALFPGVNDVGKVSGQWYPKFVPIVDVVVVVYERLSKMKTRLINETCCLATDGLSQHLMEPHDLFPGV